ncbi:uncharacterized protein EKO05_0011139 [Ascochyta rabiei]|uniref:uncharacterized protein n=1 Tax=Didymella rabiei TaxID=5454 RepID=UPI0021FF9DE6|nr:uncharacterized protein EKO05_0011139 [Ascochyta rabiei]UPX20929.1 hypothetical protein EKO05_0011139 [Ascochyta rabiei]
MGEAVPCYLDSGEQEEPRCAALHCTALHCTALHCTGEIRASRPSRRHACLECILFWDTTITITITITAPARHPPCAWLLAVHSIGQAGRNTRNSCSCATLALTCEWRSWPAKQDREKASSQEHHALLTHHWRRGSSRQPRCPSPLPSGPFGLTGLWNAAGRLTLRFDETPHPPAIRHVR